MPNYGIFLTHEELVALFSELPKGYAVDVPRLDPDLVSAIGKVTTALRASLADKELDDYESTLYKPPVVVHVPEPRRLRVKRK